MTATAESFLRVEEVVEKVRTIINGADHIAVLTHKDADADSLGSALAFATSLRGLEKNVHVIVPEPMPMMLTYLPGYETIAPAPPHIDALFTFDCATQHRFGEKRALVETIHPLINVDHHIGNEAFGDINLVEVDASATGMVVYRLLQALDAPIGAAVAVNLYAALLTDTGGFRHENTTEAALRMAAELVAHGADPGFVALKSYKSRSFGQMKLEGLSMSAMGADRDGTLVWSTVTQEMLTDTGCDMQESEAIIDALQSIDTLKVGILFKEVAPAVTKISVRTRDQYDATVICKHFGGGGHRRASGAEIDLPIAEAVPTVLAYARRFMDGEA